MVIVTVDTAKDSAAQIRRAMKFLEEALAEQEGQLAAKEKTPIDIQDFLPVETLLPQATIPEEQKPERLTEPARKILPALDPSAVFKDLARREKKPERKQEKGTEQQKPEIQVEDNKDTFIEIVEYD